MKNQGRIACLGHGAYTPLGESSATNFDAMQHGKTGVRRHGQGTSLSPSEPLAASLFPQRETEGDGLSFFETIALRAAREAILASGIAPSSPDVAFVLSTIKGNVERLAPLGQGTADDGSNDLPVSARRIASHFGNSNPPLVVSNACISGLAALIQGQRMLAEGRCRFVVVVGAEVQSRFIVSGFQALKALSEAPCRPFDAQRTGLNLGEGAAAMVLGHSEDGWELCPGCIRNDANHLSAPSRTAEGSFHALRSVLGHLDGQLPDFVGVHGTATAYNDEMEALALRRAGLLDVPICGLKGYFGHTMGAAGVLETILSLMAADEGIIPGTLGFSTLGVSAPVNVSEKQRACRKGGMFLKMLSGFGGVNAAMALRKS